MAQHPWIDQAQALDVPFFCVSRAVHTTHAAFALQGLSSIPGTHVREDIIAKAQHLKNTAPDKHRYPVGWWRIVVDMNPFTVIQYPYSEDGIADMRSKVRDLGFVLTAEEEKAWDAFIEEMKNY